ncbi:MAG: hypothetical protein NMNS01_29490 [Nitrosomonas sp.]|jgi:hypothetical protein|nr:MAG: hypothetical protein NMNS01_29490 [Nitrosomonas sp.]
MKQNAQKLIGMQNMVIKWAVNPGTYNLTTKLSTDSVDKLNMGVLQRRQQK